jgi:hypothetical protein
VASRVDEAQQIAHNRTAIAAGELERAYAASIAQPGTPQAESNAIRVTNRAERELARANEGECTGIVRRLLAEAPDAATRGVLAQELPTLAGVEPEFIRSMLIETDPAASAPLPAFCAMHRRAR